MAYSLFDFTESLDRLEANHGFERDDVVEVLAAWGGSPEGYGSWEGGFLMRLKDGRFAYLSGWCDTTGWGCQDGIDTETFDVRPDLADLKQDYPNYGEDSEEAKRWDDAPADLNRFLKGEIDEWGKAIAHPRKDDVMASDAFGTPSDDFKRGKAEGYQEGLEAAVRVCEEAHPSRFGRDIAQRIRALKADKPTG